MMNYLRAIDSLDSSFSQFSNYLTFLNISEFFDVTKRFQ